jgi:hypothetical protein
LPPQTHQTPHPKPHVNHRPTPDPPTPQESDALAYGRPYREDPAASAAVWATMEKLPPWGDLLKRVGGGFVCLFGCLVAWLVGWLVGGFGGKEAAALGGPAGVGFWRLDASTLLLREG